MDNTSLFKFDFVDRESPKKLIQDLLNDKLNTNVIWFNGHHGVGKSYFFENLSCFIDLPQTVYIELNAEDSEPNCLKDLINNISRITKISFLKFFKENYMEVINILKNVVVFTTKQITDIDLGSLVNSMFDVSKLFVYNKQATREQQNATKMLCNYLDEILKNQKMLIIIDNFSFCDKKSLSIIIDTILNYQQNKSNHNIYFILATTTNVNDNFVINNIKERVPVKYCEIESFGNVKYFSSILNKIFDLPRKTISKIFDFCEGNPQKLREFIHELYDKKGIIFDERRKPTVSNNIVNKIIDSGSTDIDLKKLSPAKRIVISIVVIFGKTMTVDFIIRMTEYIISNLSFYPTVEYNQMATVIFELINDDILKLYNVDETSYIKMEHDLKFDSIKSQLEKDPFQQQINKNIFLFLNSCGDQYYEEAELIDSLAYHSYEARVGNWQTLNLESGKNKYNMSLYESGCETFDRIIEFVDNLSFDDKLLLADCYFQNGRYLDADFILKNIYETEEFKNNFSAYCLYAKIRGILLDKKFAVELVDTALKLPNTTELMQLRAECIKQQALTNYKDSRPQAKELFNSIKNRCSKNIKDTIDYCNFLVSSVEFYRGDSAQNDLKEAEKIAILHNDQLLLGEIYFHKGFDNFWEADLESSKSNMEKSLDIFRRIRQHESAYPLNNLASYYMITNDIDRAILCLNEALLWAQSEYAKIVIKTQLMVCYSLLLDPYCLALSEEIQNDTKTNTINDVSAYIKFNYNLGYVYKKMSKKYEANECFYNAITKANSLDPNSLPHTWISEIDENINKIVKDKLSNHQNHLSERYDPWLLTLNHY